MASGSIIYGYSTGMMHPWRDNGMEILRKNIGKGEIDWRGVVIPRDKKSLLPPIGVEFELSDEGNTYKVKVDNQYRIRLSEWFKRHPSIKPGDEVVFSEESGSVRIVLSGVGKKSAWSTRELLGKETCKGKIIDIEHTSDGAIAVVQRTERVPLEDLLKGL
jgi:bifunctional DNA-binding transcriptional regulator/antitoxin component of YhaV-PrlF toxin-antitoxin module